jgi:Asp/Glu/hydantoin racemase
MHSAVRTNLIELDFYTAPAATAPASIEGTTDSVISAAACLHELRPHVDKWDGVSKLPSIP